MIYRCSVSIIYSMYVYRIFCRYVMVCYEVLMPRFDPQASAPAHIMARQPMIVRPMAAEIALRVEALQPNVLARIHRHRCARGPNIRQFLGCPLAPGPYKICTKLWGQKTSRSQPRGHGLKMAMVKFKGHPVVRCGQAAAGPARV